MNFVMNYAPGAGSIAHTSITYLHKHKLFIARYTSDLTFCDIKHNPLTTNWHTERHRIHYNQRYNNYPIYIQADYYEDMQPTPYAYLGFCLQYKVAIDSEYYRPAN